MTSPDKIEGHALGDRNGAATKLVQQTFSSGSSRVKRENVDDLYKAHIEEILRKGRT